MTRKIWIGLWLPVWGDIATPESGLIDDFGDLNRALFIVRLLGDRTMRLERDQVDEQAFVEPEHKYAAFGRLSAPVDPGGQLELAAARLQADLIPAGDPERLGVCRVKRSEERRVGNAR